MPRKVIIAADHGGFSLKSDIKEKFSDIAWVDLGCDSSESVDYPDYAHKLAEALEGDDTASGILICGTGIGISITANRHAHIRAALCTDSTMARLTRQHNDANVLCLGARVTGAEAVFDIVETFLNTEFEGGRHARRIEKINLKING